MYRVHGRSRQLLLAALIAAGSLLTGTLNARHASAQLGVCYGDPIIQFNNGTKLQITVAIQSDAAAVQAIQYQVHIPAGVRIKKVRFPKGELAQLEVVNPIFDAAPNTYTADTIVTSTGTFAMTTTMQVRGKGTGGDEGDDSTTAPPTSLDIEAGMTNSDILNAVQF
jgi:hypothetical protein